MITLGEVWVIDLPSAGIVGRIESVILTRSMSARLKFVVATADKFAILAITNGEVEKLETLDEGFTGTPKLMPITTGFSIANKNKIIVKKLTSSGMVDETYKPCQMVSNIVDTIYDLRNPSLIFALTETTNELVLF